MNGTIPEALLAIADEVVSAELLRSRPERCDVCKPGDPCWFHKSWQRMEQRDVK